VGTLVSGTTYTCTVTLPYSWLLSSPASDKITLDYAANLNYGFQLAASNGADTAVEPLSAKAIKASPASVCRPVAQPLRKTSA